jgi:hypothetical protein
MGLREHAASPATTTFDETPSNRGPGLATGAEAMEFHSKRDTRSTPTSGVGGGFKLLR